MTPVIVVLLFVHICLVTDSPSCCLLDAIRSNVGMFQSYVDDVSPKKTPRGSYTQRFRKLAGLEQPLPSIEHSDSSEKRPTITNVTRQHRALAERPNDVITKSGLNRLTHVRIL